MCYSSQHNCVCTLILLDVYKKVETVICNTYHSARYSGYLCNTFLSHISFSVGVYTPVSTLFQMLIITLKRNDRHIFFLYESYTLKMYRLKFLGLKSGKYGLLDYVVLKMHFKSISLVDYTSNISAKSDKSIHHNPIRWTPVFKTFSIVGLFVLSDFQFFFCPSLRTSTKSSIFANR